MRDDAVRAGCPAPEELTALAHGEGQGAARSALLRHVMSCATCRADHAAAERMLLALRGLGAARASQAPVGSPPRRPRPLRWAWVPPAVAAAAVALALLGPLNSGPEGTPTTTLPMRSAAGTPSAIVAQPGNLEALLAAQEPDGYWAAEPGLEGRAGHEAATALVLLGLLHPGAEALRDPALARAVASGSRWLAGRAAGLTLGERASPADVRTRAVVSAALLRTQHLTQDSALRPAARSLLAAVTRDAEASADHVSRPWLDYALATAQEAGWAGAGRDRRTLAAAPRPVEPSPDLDPRASRSVEREAGVAGTPVRWALEALRNEPSLSRFALAVSTTSR